MERTAVPAEITYWGYTAIRIVTEAGTTVLLDPYLDANPDSPVKVADLDRVDLILVTHATWDHLGNAFAIARRTGARLLAGSEVVAYARRQGVPREQTAIMSPGGRRTHLDVTVQAVEAHHVSFTETVDGQFLSGQPLSFVVMLPSGERIYHSGDTSIFSDMKLFGELYRPNIAIFAAGAIPGGGTHISPYESALACRWLGVRSVIPVHYSDPRDVAELQTHLQDLHPGATLVALRPGETFRAPASPGREASEA